MRKNFPGYYRPAEEDFKKLWDEGIFVFDANVLLNVYRYSSKTLKNFLDILERLQDRLWIPHQAAYEYQENRLRVISAQNQAYEDIPKLINDLLVKMGSSYPRHPFINTSKIMSMMTNFINNVEKELNTSKQRHRDLIIEDDLRDQLDVLFQNKVGDPYDNVQLKSIFNEADKRYQNEIPPGYKDNKKSDARKYGDVLVWFQIKDYAKTIKKPILLITDDKKDDWWSEHKGKTIGPRPELIQEIKDESGIDFYMYESDRFISYAQQYLKLADGQAVNEAREVKLNEQKIKERQKSFIPDLPGYFVSKDTDVYKTETEILKYIVDKPEGFTIQELTDYLKKPRRLIAEAVTDLYYRRIFLIKATDPDVIYQFKTQV
jgi:hypothetical protein